MKTFNQYINEDLGDTPQGQRKLTKYINKALMQQDAFHAASRLFMSRASDRNAIESPRVNVEKSFKMKQKANIRAAGLERAVKLRKDLESK